MERAEEVRASEGLNDLLCIKFCVRAAVWEKPAGDFCLSANIQFSVVVFHRCPGDRGEVREAGPGARHVLPVRLRGVVQRWRD